MKNAVMKLLKNKNLINVLVMLVVAMIVFSPMLSSKVNVYRDDGAQHIARAYGTLNAIKSGTFFGNIIPSFVNNYGYSWNIFYGAITTFGIIIFKIITGSYIAGYKVFCFICLLLSGITMYALVKKISENSNMAVLAGVLYMIAPYHLTDVYVRNAIGEFTSFLFIPLVFLGLHNIFKEKNNDWVLTIGSVGLLFTHNITSLYVAVLALIYVIVNFKQLLNKEILKKLCINGLFILLISSCFLLPLLEAKQLADYRVYEPDAMYTLEGIQEQRISLKRLFVTGNDDVFVFELGPYMIIMLAFSVMTIRILKKEYRKDYLFFLICGIFTMLMATKIFPWNLIPNPFRIIQFPWRCLTFSCFFLSIVSAINMGALIKNFSFKDSLIMIIIALAYIIALKGFVIYSQEDLKNIEDMKIGYITGTTEREYIARYWRRRVFTFKSLCK